MQIVAFLATALVGFAMIAEPAISFAKAASATAPDLIFSGVTTLFLAVDTLLGCVDEFWRDDVFAIPLRNRA